MAEFLSALWQLFLICLTLVGGLIALIIVLFLLRIIIDLIKYRD